MSEKCFLTWNNFQENISDHFSALRQELELCDVTLVCEDNQQIKVHKVVLSSCSPLFKDILKTSIHSHPLIYFWNVKQRDLCNIVDFVYSGKVQVYQSDLNEFLSIATKLGIKGISRQYSGKNEWKELHSEPDIVVAQKKENIEDFTNYEEIVLSNGKESITETASIQTPVYYTESEINKVTNNKDNLPEGRRQQNAIVRKNKYKKDRIETESLLGHISTNFEDNIQPFPNNAERFRKGGGKVRGPLWNYFKDDPTDISFATCNICHRRISRGKTGGEPQGNLNSSSLRSHLTTHPHEWQEYEELKYKRNKTSKEHIPTLIEQQTEYVPLNDCEKKEITSPYEPITTFFDGDIQPIPKIAQRVRKPGGKKRESVWNYFKEDPTDVAFASCVICNKRISRRKTGEPLGELNNSSMNNHLRSHKKEIEKKPKEKNKETESKVWEFFEKDDVNPESLLCQVYIYLSITVHIHIHIITYSTFLGTSDKGLVLSLTPSP